MVKDDEKDLELQVAAVALCEELGARRQKDVAAELARIYQSRGAFDNTRVSRLCTYAIRANLAHPPVRAKLVPGPVTDEWLEAFRLARSSVSLDEPIRRRLEGFCRKHGVAAAPSVAVVSGNVKKRDGQATSEFAANAARVALKYARDWLANNPQQRLRLGVAWGRQMHLAAVAAKQMLMGGYLDTARLSVVPLVGLPIGGHLGDIMSSSEIAKALTSPGSEGAPGGAYELQLIPAYLPESEFSDQDLPALYKLLGLVEGWTKIFGANHMAGQSEDQRSGSVPEVFGCDFIWSSVSNLFEPYGFVTSKRKSLVPFAEQPHAEGVPAPRPAADCGGVPLWADTRPEIAAAAEASFDRRWTGIRRRQWRHCVEQGTRVRAKENVVSGAVLFAPTAEKAEPLLYAVRDGLANALILGRPCAERMMEIFRQEDAGD